MSETRMVEILTGSWRTVLPQLVTPVAVSRGTPRRIGGYRRLRVLEPGSWFRSVTPAQYLDLYSKILDRHDPAEIYERLIAFGDNPIMLCWELASDCQSGKAFCHRHLVARWLEDRSAIKVREFGYPQLDRFALLRKHGIPAPDYRDTAIIKQRIASDNKNSRN